MSVISIIMITNQVIMIAIKHDYRDSGAAARSDTPPSDEHGGVREDALFVLVHGGVDRPTALFFWGTVY